MAEKSVYERSLMGESPIDYEAIATKRIVTQVTDSNQGSYNGWIRFNSNSFGGLMTSFAEGFVSTPIKIVATAGTSNTVSQWTLGLKNGTVNLYDQVEFKLNGVSIITPQVFNNIPAVFVMLASWSQETLRKYGPSLGFWPDSCGSIKYNPIGTPGAQGLGFCNNIDVAPTTGTTGGLALINTTAPESYNEGFYLRQKFINSYNSAGYGGMTGTVGSPSTPGIAATSLIQVQKSYVVVSGQTATFNLMINTRLPDLGDVFDKIPLTEIGTLELNLGYNQFNPTVSPTTGPTLTQATSGLQFGNTCPFMVASSSTNNGGALLATAANDNTFVMTVGSNALTTGCTLTIPQYELTPEYRAQLLSTRPVQTVRYERIYYQVQTGIAPNGTINTQVVPSITNPKWLLSVPAATVGAAAPYVLVSEPQSCFDSFPGTTMPLASISQYQVNLGTRPVFSSPVTYEYDHFLNNVSRIQALNGGATDRLNSGLISEFMWTNAMRYYVADLSRRSVENISVPTSVNVLGINNSATPMDLHTFLMYGDEFKIHTATGVIEK